MKPPNCQLCRNNLRNHDGKFKLLRFKISVEDEAVNKRMRDERMVGHPKGAYWFCSDHKDQAKLLTHLSINEALAVMRRPPQPPSLWQKMKRLILRR